MVGGLALAPLLPGTIQALKARLQGRRGPSPLQPYRELRRLWGKTLVDPQPTTVVYRLAPCLVAAAMALALFLVPIAGLSPGLAARQRRRSSSSACFALARFALAAASWDTGSGFALMGSSRDLTLSVFAEALLVLALILAALPAGSTDLVAMSAAANGSAIWSEPAHWCAAAAFGLVVLFETGRQPIDNPDTHLELTMIHEGPLLEYARPRPGAAGVERRRPALDRARRSPPSCSCPTGEASAPASPAWPAASRCSARRWRFTETAQAKMRILRAPALLAGGCLLALVGLTSWLVS